MSSWMLTALIIRLLFTQVGIIQKHVLALCPTVETLLCYFSGLFTPDSNQAHYKRFPFKNTTLVHSLVQKICLQEVFFAVCLTAPPTPCREDYRFLTLLLTLALACLYLEKLLQDSWKPCTYFFRNLLYEKLSSLLVFGIDRCVPLLCITHWLWRTWIKPSNTEETTLCQHA